MPNESNVFRRPPRVPVGWLHQWGRGVCLLLVFGILYAIVTVPLSIPMALQDSYERDGEKGWSIFWGVIGAISMFLLGPLAFYWTFAALAHRFREWWDDDVRLPPAPGEQEGHIHGSIKEGHGNETRNDQERTQSIQGVPESP